MSKNIKRISQRAFFLTTVFMVSLASLALMGPSGGDTSFTNGFHPEIAPELSKIGHFAFSVVKSIFFGF